MKYIRVFNLPPEITDKQLIDNILKFGKVASTKREKYGINSLLPVYSGVRGIYMEVEKDLPQYIYVENIKARIYYNGMKEKCFRCGDETHKKVECPLMQGNKPATIMETDTTESTANKKETKVTYSDITKITTTAIVSKNSETTSGMVNVREHMIRKQNREETETSSCNESEHAERNSLKQRKKQLKKDKQISNNPKDSNIALPQIPRLTVRMVDNKFVTHLHTDSDK